MDVFTEMNDVKTIDIYLHEELIDDLLNWSRISER